MQKFRPRFIYIEATSTLHWIKRVLINAEQDSYTYKVWKCVGLYLLSVHDL
jgi:hypothetical protein